MKTLSKFLLIICLAILPLNAAVAKDKLVNGLNVMVTSADTQTQLMAMVLSLQTIKKHNKKVNMVLCGPAGKLGLKTTKTPKLKPKNISPTMLLKKIIKLGANVQVCPLYLPNAGKTKSDLITGITVAKPPQVAKHLLKTNLKNLTY